MDDVAEALRAMKTLPKGLAASMDSPGVNRCWIAVEGEGWRERC